MQDDKNKGKLEEYRNRGSSGEDKTDDKLFSCVKGSIEACSIYVVKMEPLISF